MGARRRSSLDQSEIHTIKHSSLNTLSTASTNQMAARIPAGLPHLRAALFLVLATTLWGLAVNSGYKWIRVRSPSCPTGGWMELTTAIAHPSRAELPIECCLLPACARPNGR